jgi:glycosyltransferase involved in cell wall biosynthesis
VTPIPNGGRLVFDITLMTRWIGRPVGIVRCEQAIAQYALRTRPDIRFVVFDKTLPAWHEIRREWVGPLIRWDTRLDSPRAHFTARRRGWRRHMPSRFMLALALERRRLSSPSRSVQRIFAGVQRLLCWPHGLPWPLGDDKGLRRNAIPAEAALEKFEPGPADTILSVGNYFNADVEAISALKRRHGFRYVTMCHDLIAHTYPAFFKDEVVRDFRRHWEAMLPVADCVLALSHAVERDIRDYCRDQGLALACVAVTPPGCDMAGMAPAAALPAGLAQGRYALFVATIEPRKGHAMILDVWKRLADAGVSQRHGFKLAVVGRPGWKMDEVLRRLGEPAEFAGTIVYLAEADDAVLARLYRDCAFGLLPSIYEGYGMPLVESFACGRTVMASTGGSLPEVAGAFAPCLPPADSAAWYALLKLWIEDERAYAPYEAAIRSAFRPFTWNEAAAGIFAAALAET